MNLHASYRVLSGLRIRIACAAVGTALSIGIMSALPLPVASAAPSVNPGSCGSVLLAGSAWLGGRGVNVKSNGADEGLGSDCSSAHSYVNGVLAGDEWQCPELVSRLYLSQGWIHATWAGDAGQPLWNNTPGNLSKQANGQVSYLGPGDVVIINVFDNGTSDGGHALVVNDSSHVTSGTVDLVSQNSGAPGNAKPQVSGTISGGKVSIGGGGGGWTYQTIGVVHAPSTQQGVLDFIKTKNTGSGKVELFEIPGPNYQRQPTVATPTWFSAGDANNGWFQMEQPTVATPTWFSPGDANNGWFQLDGSTLVFIKTKNTGSGKVELFEIPGPNYQRQPTVATPTWFSAGDANNGWFQMASWTENRWRGVNAHRYRP